jgi:hypothetical protein
MGAEEFVDPGFRESKSLHEFLEEAARVRVFQTCSI